VDPRAQDSPPFGYVTVSDGVDVDEVDPLMAKLLLLVSVIAGFVVLVILIR
jgi:hypothetical protein